MKKKYTLPFLFIILLSTAWMLPQPDDTLIYHDNNVKLRWKDYKATPDPDFGAIAVSYVGFRMSYKGTARQDSLIVIVESFFDPKISWTKPDTTAYTLTHEQLHFDITELYSRKLKLSIQNATLTYKNYQSVMRELERAAHKDMNTADSIYEVATDYSRNATEQKKWNENIAADLKNMSTYAKDTFVVAVHL